MAHRIRFDMTSAFGINLKQGGYVLYVNPFYLTTPAARCYEGWH